MFSFADAPTPPRLGYTLGNEFPSPNCSKERQLVIELL